MRISLKLLNWIFILYAIIPPLIIIGISIRSGIGQGIQFIFLPILILYFYILFWWTRNIVSYISVSAGTITTNEKYFILLQILSLYLLVVAPLVILTTHLIWNRITRPTPLENIGALCFMFLISSGMFLSVIGIALGLRYRHKTNKINPVDNN